MGSRAEFRSMVDFVSTKQIRPVVSRTIQAGFNDLKDIDDLFEDMRNGRQFGKLVIEIRSDGDASNENDGKSRL